MVLGEHDQPPGIMTLPSKIFPERAYRPVSRVVAVVLAGEQNVELVVDVGAQESADRCQRLRRESDVFVERVETFGLSDIQAESVLIPFGLMKYYTGVDVIRVLDAQADSAEDVPSVERQITQILKSRHPPEAEYNVQTLTAILDAARTISLALTVVLIVIAFIALLISGIGIMNIMLVTVKERTREIGIRKAIGAARREILYQFLIEAFLISGGGAVLGILIGLAIPVTVQFFLPGNLRVPVSGASVILAFVVSCSTGLFFGYLPASQAAKLQPIESLRYE